MFFSSFVSETTNQNTHCSKQASGRGRGRRRESAPLPWPSERLHWQQQRRPLQISIFFFLKEKRKNREYSVRVSIKFRIAAEREKMVHEPSDGNDLVTMGVSGEEKRLGWRQRFSSTRCAHQKMTSTTICSVFALFFFYSSTLTGHLLVLAGRLVGAETLGHCVFWIHGMSLRWSFREKIERFSFVFCLHRFRRKNADDGVEKKTTAFLLLRQATKTAHRGGRCAGLPSRLLWK